MTTTSKTSLKNKFFDKNYKSLFFKGDDYDRDIIKELASSNKVLISIPPKDGKDIVSSIKIKNLKKEHYTNLYINDIILDSGIDDNYFKEHRLKRIPN